MNNNASAENKGRPRPLSPHLSIYKPQITSVMSILHRMTGIFILLGGFVFVLHLVGMAGGICKCISILLTTTYGLTAIYLWVMALYYHFFNGIRHMIWDSGKGFEKEQVVLSGIFVLLATIAALGFTWMVTI